MEARTFRPHPVMTAHLPAAMMAQWDRSPDALVLIVEDEAEIADIIAAYLEREKLRVLRAADGRTALELHHSARPDLVLLDVQLPDIDGGGVLSHVFDPFMRGDGSRSRQGGGSGLGLAVVKAIADAHGGQVSCSSGATGGSRFVLELPRE